ncbi:MAG: hypothetical protein J0J10_14480 [Bosea sp.]|uniref:hypothetical protein n=1 Tax=Bosea sp. (in: a-proteobacteria) TaxID=1871050 RepID=UPI001AC21C0C|nr:hypothetical protein [Bosea sp. (in: a-proteobacteria)]MBN9469969.1 hypothetical protein [Bosea sp. (in: a-proteobacteria)]
MAKHRTKEEIAAEKLAKEQRIAERLAKRAEKDAEAERKRKAKVAAEAKRQREQRLLSASLANRTAAQEAAYQAEVEALSIEEPSRKKLRKEVRNQMIAFAFLCDFTVEQVRQMVVNDQKIGVVARVVQDGKLEAVRRGDGRIKKLADLFGKLGPHHQRFAMHCAATSPTRRLHRDLLNYLAVKTERVTETQRMRGGGEMTWNPHVSALHMEARLGGIDEHCLQAGVWLSTVFDRVGQGAVRGFDPTSAGIRGTARAADAIETEAAAKSDAINQIRGVEGHIRRAFIADGSWEMRWKVIEHVVRYDRALDKFDLPARFGSPVKFLNAALEEVALGPGQKAPAGVYSQAVSGERAAAFEQADRMLAEAMRLARVAKRAESEG